MDPAVVVAIVPLLPSAAPALGGPFVVAAATVLGALGILVVLVLQSVPAPDRRRPIVLDVVARPVVEGRPTQRGAEL